LVPATIYGNSPRVAYSPGYVTHNTHAHMSNHITDSLAAHIPAK